MVQVIEDYENNVIEGFCTIGWRKRVLVISIRKLTNYTWHISQSMSLPSNLTDAREVMKCFNETMAVFDGQD